MHVTFFCSTIVKTKKVMKRLLLVFAVLFFTFYCYDGQGQKNVNAPTTENSSSIAPNANMDSYQSKYRGKKCTVKGPHDTQPCKCSGFDASNRDASVCRKCGHKAVKHTR